MNRIRLMAAALLAAGVLTPPADAADAVKAAQAKAGNAAFPLRSQYLDVGVIETNALVRRFAEVTIVDVRSRYEFDTLRVKDAALIPVTDRDFVDQLRKLQATNSRPLVFYCNGKTCRKSYDAALKALNAGFRDVLCYDAGIADWAKAQPERTVLLGKSPVRPEDLLSHEQFKARLLEPKEFEARVGPNAIVLDVRDRVQRDSPLFPMREERAQLEQIASIEPIVERAKREKKTLLVYDQVGKQVEWFQYYLESKGVRDYYFLKGGAQAYFESKLGKVSLGGKKGK